MDSPVAWPPDGQPRSTPFDGIYSRQGGNGQGSLAQAREVFLAGSGLPAAWAGQPAWHILETGFGLGLNFLAAWQAWRLDPQRPRLLQFSAIEAWPVTADELLRSVQPLPELAPLATQLAAAWQGLLPGFHRLAFEQGQVQLTLCVGQVQPMLRELDTAADAVFLDGFNPQINPERWDAQTLKAVARLCRPGTRLASWSVAPQVCEALARLAFSVHMRAGLPPQRYRLEAEYAPHWQPRSSARRRTTGLPGRCVVVGAGLAGSAVAASLARRGWQVEVLDAGAQPAAGASGLPAGIVAPHVSPDDSRLSRLTRAGVRATLQRAAELLAPGQDWQASGVLEHCVEGKHALPAPERWPEAGQAWSRPASDAQRAQAGVPPGAPALWHGLAGWLRPWRLVEAQLALPGIRFQGQAQVAALRREGGCWRLLDAAGQTLAEAEQLVLAAGFESLALLQACTPAPAVLPPLNPLRGQVTLGQRAALDDAARALLPPFPVNGHGNFVATGEAWCAGATFERGAREAGLKPQDHAANFEKMSRLLPAFAAAAAPAFAPAQAQGWAGLRCTLPDRLPAVGPLDPERLPGLHLCTGLGARGISLSVLCGELLAAWLQGEPLPIEPSLARGLMAERWLRDTPRASIART